MGEVSIGERNLLGRPPNAGIFQAAAHAAAKAIDPLDDPNVGDEYRRSIVRAMVFRALAFRGEFGNLGVLPQLTQFLEVEDRGFGDVARWAFHRIAFRQPAAALNPGLRPGP